MIAKRNLPVGLFGATGLLAAPMYGRGTFGVTTLIALIGAVLVVMIGVAAYAVVKVARDTGCSARDAAESLAVVIRSLRGGRGDPP